MTRSLMILALFLFSASAFADDPFYPSRVRLAAHGGVDLNDTNRLEFRFAPAGNLVTGIAPLTFLGAKIKALSWLTVEPYIGWASKTNEPIFSLSLNPHFDKLWAWTEIDLRAPSKDGYWFAMTDYKFLDWLHAGAEGEGWGNYQSSSSWTHGGGPNVLLRFGQTGLDTALHIREVGGIVKPELVLRVHLFL